MMVTALYAGLLGLLFLALSWRVVQLRRRYKTGLGDGGFPDLSRAIRVHGNFVEYVPMTLVLLAILETGANLSPLVLHALGAALFVARLFHAQGLTASGGASFGRFTGTLLTWVTLLAVSVLLIAAGFD